jgi:thiol-disulfide isomerase/thioredoxin
MKNLFRLILCFILQTSFAQNTLTIIQSGIMDVTPELAVAGYSDSTLVKLNDSTFLFTYTFSLPEYLYIVIDYPNRWKARVWMDPNIKNRELIIDYAHKTTTLANADDWDKIMMATDLAYDEFNFKKADSISIDYILKNISNYKSLWFLTHGTAREDIVLKKKLFNTLSSSLAIYPEYKQLKGDLFLRNYPSTGDAFKEFSLMDKNDLELNTATIKNKWILLHFWSNSCGPCIKEMDDFVKLYESIDTSKIAFISIGLDVTNKRWKEGTASHKIKGYSVWTQGDVYCDLCLHYDLPAMPFFILFDNNKKLVYTKDGANELENIKETLIRIK